MGNDSSQLKGLEIEEKPIELTDFWAHHQATFIDNCTYFSLKGDGSVTIFKGEAVSGPLWTISSPLEKCSNNLLKYRHPCILRYITAWQQRSTWHLATEFVLPLSHVLETMTPLQLCIGLNNILEALVFLHEQAGMSHNNVSVSAIYVTADGQWKLGGMQYLHSFKELTPAYLKHARIHRYDKAVDPNEASHETTLKVDQYAFAALVEDVYKGKIDDDVPYINAFKKYCRDYLQHTEPQKRPLLSEVLHHNFFNHEFITIYKFLTFLPLKSEEEKKVFFTNILQNIQCYDEETVAKQLAGLLLSRLIMLDPTARKYVLPFIFQPRNDRTQNGESFGVFRLSMFKEHIKPRLMQLFIVRDTQIRMLLLSHFSKYVHVFTHDELSQHILPELLLGIKDNDDSLVASTLVCLSELVPILGATTVIGGKRSKYFTDGRPNNQNINFRNESSMNRVKIPLKSLEDFPCSEKIYHLTSNKANSINECSGNNLNMDMADFDKSLILRERPTPVGGESVDEELTDSSPQKAHTAKCPDSENDWGDWDNTNQQTEIISAQNSTDDKCLLEKVTGMLDSKVVNMQQAALEAKMNIIDISELDIKNQKNANYKKNSNDEFDFFADMTPVIEKSTIGKAVEQENSSKEFSSKLNFVPDEGIEENEMWGENWND